MNGTIENRLQSKLTFLLLCMSLLAVPFNIVFFQIVRLSDLFFLVTVILYATTNPKIKSAYLIIISLFYGSLFLSSLISILHKNDIRFEGVVFYYKYSLLFLIPFVVNKVVDSRIRLKRIVSILYYIYLFLVVWVFVYYMLRTNNILQGNTRVSYPFSDYFTNDSHVYSSYMSFTFVAYNEYIKKILSHGRIHSAILFVASIIALLLTGSKTGIMILIVYSSIIIFRSIRSLRKKEINFLISLLIIATILSFMLPNISNNEALNKDIQSLYQRATTVNFEDKSISNRKIYFLSAIAEIIPNLLLIGNGPTGASKKWYDGGISILLAHSGLLGVFVIINYIFLFIIKSRNMSIAVNMFDLYKIFVLLILTYTLLSVITEHFLITRNILPAATILSIIYVNIRLNYFDYITIQRHYKKAFN